MPPVVQLLYAGAQTQVSGTWYLRFSTSLGKAWLASLTATAGEGKKDELSPSPAPEKASPAGWAGSELPVAEQLPTGRSQHPAACPAGKLGWWEIGMEGEHIYHKASASVCKELNTILEQWGQAQESSAPVNDALRPLPRQFTFLSSRFPLYLTQVLGKYMMTDYLPAAPSPSLPLSPGSITNKSPHWERGPEETRGTKPQTEPFPPLLSQAALHFITVARPALAQLGRRRGGGGPAGFACQEQKSQPEEQEKGVVCVCHHIPALAWP